jgi:hypothetical protein
VQVGQLDQNRMLFGGAFQSSQRAGRSSDEPPAEDFLDELPPPAWREDEVSVECDAARMRVDRRDLNLFVVRDTKGQPGDEHELPRRTHVEHVETDAQHAGSKDDMIARAHWARGGGIRTGRCAPPISWIRRCRGRRSICVRRTVRHRRGSDDGAVYGVGMR